MTIDWFDGIAKIIVALGSLGGVIAAVAAWRAASSATSKLDNVATAQKLDEVHSQNDGKLTALMKEIESLKGEIVRLQAPGTTTPYGPPTDVDPVTLSAGMPTTQKKPL